MFGGTTDFLSSQPIPHINTNRSFRPSANELLRNKRNEWEKKESPFAINLKKRVSLHDHVLLKALRAVLFDYLRILRFLALETHF